jgi:uncharacterized protein YbjT (DUF2867 family)
MIVVTTPTGQIGRDVVQNLLNADQRVCVIARHAHKLPEALRDRVEVIEGSHGDAATVEQAFEGAEAVLWVAPPDMKKTLEQAYVEFSQPAAKVLRRLGGRRVVSVTGIGRGTPWEDKAGAVAASIRMDNLLGSSAAAFRGLAMPSFMENFLRQVSAIKEKSLISGVFDPDRKMPWTSTRDLAAVAARFLTDSTWTGNEEIPILGPDVLSFSEIAQIISEVTGRTVRYQQTTYEALKQQYRARGANQSFAQGLVDMYRAKNEGMDNTALSIKAERTPTSFRSWCERNLNSALLG